MINMISTLLLFVGIVVTSCYYLISLGRKIVSKGFHLKLEI